MPHVSNPSPKNNVEEPSLASQLLPYGLVLAWVIPLLFFSNGHSSLMAYDEGLYATRARFMFDTGDWIHPWVDPHHKPPGFYWLIASSYTFFGVSEFTARLPSILASIVNALLFFQIGKTLLTTRIALISTFCLYSSFLWIQYSRLASIDTPFIGCFLFALLGLLNAEKAFSKSQEKKRRNWLFGAGLALGLIVILRGASVLLAIVALLPYLIGNYRRHKHLSHPAIYIGFAIGLLPTLIWIALGWPRFGSRVVNRLYDFIHRDVN